MLTKVVYLLNINGYPREITDITYPLIRFWARKIGATVQEIRNRKFPGWPITYEKLQIYELANQNCADWHIYLDSDALVHPETPDWTNYIPRDTVVHNGIDMANVRWQYDEYFRRDGRNVGSCNWNTIASWDCRDLWRPIDDLTPDQAISRIFPTVEELNTVITPEHLIDDYALSRNIARFGLKIQTLMTLEKQLGFTNAGFYWHAYVLTLDQKVEEMKKVLDGWKLNLARYR
jgi:hypothetical protein